MVSEVGFTQKKIRLVMQYFPDDIVCCCSYLTRTTNTISSTQMVSKEESIRRTNTVSYAIFLYFFYYCSYLIRPTNTTPSTPASTPGSGPESRSTFDGHLKVEDATASRRSNYTTKL